jgi:Ca2+-binding RTX toxin-like protein
LIPIAEVKRTGLVAKVISRYKWCLGKFLVSLGVAFTLATGATLLLPSIGLAQADAQRAVLRELAADTEGGSGRDTIIGGPGKDVMSGQAGRDKLLAKYAGTDRLNGGLGLDSGSWNRRDRTRSIERRLP